MREWYGSRKACGTNNIEEVFFLGAGEGDTSILSQERVTFKESQALCRLYVGGARQWPKLQLFLSTPEKSKGNLKCSGLLKCHIGLSGLKRCEYALWA